MFLLWTKLVVLAWSPTECPQSRPHLNTVRGVLGKRRITDDVNGLSNMMLVWFDASAWSSCSSCVQQKQNPCEFVFSLSPLSFSFLVFFIYVALNEAANPSERKEMKVQSEPHANRVKLVSWLRGGGFFTEQQDKINLHKRSKRRGEENRGEDGERSSPRPSTRKISVLWEQNKKANTDLKRL